MSEVEWRPAYGHPGYEASSDGRIRRVRDGRILSPWKNHDGYLIVSIKHGDRDRYRVHLIVAETFIGPRPEGQWCNHKDGDRANASAANLEWVSQRLNMLHSVYVSGSCGPISVRATHVETGEVRDFPSMTAAEVALGMPRCSVRLRIKHSSLFGPWRFTQTGVRLENKKGGSRGESHGCARLTDEQVREIRRLGGTMPQKEIAAMYGISITHVSGLIRGFRRASA